ncbi:MAG: VTT domain-containing protein [Cyanobacteria bacterium]|nr:VTT domain-containing protein [Cyanobacteriota bacterium]
MNPLSNFLEHYTKLWMYQITSGQLINGFIPGQEYWIVLHFLAFLLSPDGSLMIYSLNSPHNSYIFATYAFVFSMIGSIGYYFLAKYCSVWVEKKFHNQFISDTGIKITHNVQKFGGMSLILFSFMPVPFLPVVLTTGLLKVPFHQVFIGLLIGRSGRFYLMGALIYTFQQAFSKYFESASLIMAGIVSLLILTSWISRKFSPSFTLSVSPKSSLNPSHIMTFKTPPPPCTLKRSHSSFPLSPLMNPTHGPFLEMDRAHNSEILSVSTHNADSNTISNNLP